MVNERTKEYYDLVIRMRRYEHSGELYYDGEADYGIGPGDPSVSSEL